MPSPECENAIEAALFYGKAILKTISANDVGKTGSHQYGYYLPTEPWRVFTKNPPEKGRLFKEEVRILWQNGRTTDSVVTWYGRKTRSEYRLTRFGKGFPWLTDSNIGSLLVLVPSGEGKMLGWVIEQEDDIAEIQAVVNMRPGSTWGTLPFEKEPMAALDDPLSQAFCDFAGSIREFPPVDVFSSFVLETTRRTDRGFNHLSRDDQLLLLLNKEYELFKMAETHLYGKQIGAGFPTMETFLSLANSILNRRKSRAGRSLENHVDFILNDSVVPHEMRPKNIRGEPDVVFPSAEAYCSPDYPASNLIVMAVKTTCKDRWRQVLNEAPRVPKKFILTTQPGISRTQLCEMHDAGVSLVVPEQIHSAYPKTGHNLEILTLGDFIQHVSDTLGLKR